MRPKDRADASDCTMKKKSAQLVAYLNKPSISRRLVISQLLWLSFTWIGLAILIDLRPITAETAFQNRHLFQVWGTIAAEFQNNPSGFKSIAIEMDRYQRENDNNWESLRTSVALWSDGNLIFASPGYPGEVSLELPTSSLQIVEASTGDWVTAAMFFDDSRVVVSLTRQYSVLNSILTLQGGVEFMTALLLTMPILFLPALMSARYASKPIRGLVNEIQARAAGDRSFVGLSLRERELVPLVRAMNGWIEQIVNSDKREFNFIIDAAHELRTPLASIAVNADGIRKTSTSQEQAEYLHGLDRSVDRARRIAAQLLSELRGDLDTAPENKGELMDVLQDRLAIMEMMARKKSISLELHGGLKKPFLAAVETLESIFDNVLMNAVRYTPDRGTIIVNAADDEHGVSVVVEDSGCGIPEAWRGSVFERFTVTPWSLPDSAGLGLSIVKSAVQKMGGRMSLDSSPQLGGLRVQLFFLHKR